MAGVICHSAGRGSGTERARSSSPNSTSRRPPTPVVEGEGAGGGGNQGGFAQRVDGDEQRLACGLHRGPHVAGHQAAVLGIAIHA